MTGKLGDALRDLGRLRVERHEHPLRAFRFAPD